MQMIQGFADGDQAVINQVNLAAHIFWQLPLYSAGIHCLTQN